MSFLLYLVIALSTSLFLIFSFNKNTLKGKLSKILGIIILLILLYNSRKIYQYIYQSFIWDKKNVELIELIPYKGLECWKTLNNRIIINNTSKIKLINSALNKMKIKNPKQPNCLKSYILLLKTKQDKSYKYLIEHTSNNGTLISTYHKGVTLGSFHSGEIMNQLYLITENPFFKIK